MARDHRMGARNAPSAPALAPTEPPPPPEGEAPTIEDEAPTVEELTTALTVEKIRAAALEAERDELLLRVSELDAALAAARADASAKREAELVAPSPAPAPAPEAPIVSRRPRAVGSLRCHLHGAPITVADGQEIPEGVDLSALPPHAFVEG